MKKSELKKLIKECIIEEGLDSKLKSFIKSFNKVSTDLEKYLELNDYDPDTIDEIMSSFDALIESIQSARN